MKSRYLTTIHWPVLAAALLLTLATPAKADQPNILFIFADDLSYEAVGYADMLDIDTPNLDRLASEGTVFENVYNMGGWNGAICIASRTSLNTGKFLWKAERADLREMIEEGQMWSQQLAQEGYTTYFSGKWHVPGAKPEDIFDVVRHVRPGMPRDREAGYNRPKDRFDYEEGWKPWDRSQGGFWAGGKHWSEVLGDDGVDYLGMSERDDNPFFMYLAFNAPHDPRQAPKEYVDRYPLERVDLPESFLPKYPYAEDIGCGAHLRDERLAPFPRTPYAVKVNRQEYYAIITHMDDQIGRILDALEATGEEDNTYIFFSADHGLSVGHHGLIGKQNMYDHSMRVPLIVKGPDIPAGKSVAARVYLQDIMATSFDLADLGKPEWVDFKSLLPLIKGEADQHYDAIYGAYLQTAQRMIVEGDYKLMLYPDAGVRRLYNLREDPLELNDISQDPANAGLVERLHQRLVELQKETGDRLDLSMTRYDEYSEVQRPKYRPEEESLSHHQAAPEWLADAKFGIYFHWGPYSVPEFGSEWYPHNMYMPNRPEYAHHLRYWGKDFEYHDFVPLFTADYFDPKDWAKLFRDAGARYAGLVAEHHDGFAMWDSQTTPWNAQDMGPGRDVLGELFDALREEGLKTIATFHHARNLQRYRPGDEPFDRMRSHYPWAEGRAPAAGEPGESFLYGNLPEERWYREIWMAKVKEVISKYYPDIIYFDSWLDEIPLEFRYDVAASFLNSALARDEEVALVHKQEDLPLSFSMLDHEKSRLESAGERLWMTDDTISKGSWSFTRDMTLKESPEVIHALADTVAKNGVVLLNVSPRYNGTIPDNQREVLHEIGDWLDINGEAIYETRPWMLYGEGPTREPAGGFNAREAFLELRYGPKDIRFTRSKDGSTIYAISLGWNPNNPVLSIESLRSGMGPEEIRSVELIGHGSVRFRRDAAGLHVSLPDAPPSTAAVSFRIR